MKQPDIPRTCLEYRNACFEKCLNGNFHGSYLPPNLTIWFVKVPTPMVELVSFMEVVVASMQVSVDILIYVHGYSIYFLHVSSMYRRSGSLCKLSPRTIPQYTFMGVPTSYHVSPNLLQFSHSPLYFPIAKATANERISNHSNMERVLPGTATF